MEYINLDDIVFRHLIKFDYDVNSAFAFKNPHHLFKIEDSIHYNTLVNNNFEDYNTLITTTNQKEHSEKLFRDLINNFTVDYFNDNKMRVFYDNGIGKYVVKDGCHRLSVIKFKRLCNNGDVPINWFNIE